MTDLFGNIEMRALSWKDPYGSLMIYGKIETRTWPTKYRGLVLICTSKVPYTVDQMIKISGLHQVKRMPFITRYSGKAIAVGELIDCRRMEPEDEDKCFVEYNPDLWCHVYKDVRPIFNPFDWKGCQGWKKLNELEINRINQVMNEA